MDPIKELEGVVKDLALAVGSVSDIKQKQDEIMAKIATYDEFVKRGFPIPQAQAGMSQEELKEIFGPYEVAKQGARLVDKFAHPGYQASEESRIEMAKYFTLFLRAAVMQQPKARDKFFELYGKANTTDVGDTGNVFPLPDIVDSEILHFARESSIILQFARIWDMTSNKQSFPTETAGVSTYWGNTTQEDNPTISEVELENIELSAYSAIRNDSMLDARSDIVSWLAEVLSEAVGMTIDDAGFNGDGGGTYAGISGLLSTACGYSVVMGGSAHFQYVGPDYLSRMIAALDGQKKIGGRFFMHGQVLHYIRTLKTTTGEPVFLPGSWGPSAPGTVFGYPYSEVIKMPNTSASAKAFLLFGNMRYMGVGRRVASAALHVDPYGLWTTNRTRFKIYNRWALKVAQPYGFVRLITG